MDNDKVILVNEHDDMVGIMDKMEAHKQGLLHRAFSIFIFNTKAILSPEKKQKVRHKED